MTAHTPDQMAMARRIADKTLPEDARGYSDFAWLTARDAALAAILETSELAAVYMGAAGQSWAENQLRAGEHLKDNTHD